MSVLQLNIWTCDLCGKVEMQSNSQVGAYDDPVIRPPEGWEPMFVIPEQYQTTSSICDACQDCQASPNWENYRGERGV